jgi:hypothetical protein
MWLKPLVCVMALAVAAPLPAGNPTASTLPPAAAVVPIEYTKQKAFAIPFHISRPERISEEPIEVQLYVSGDRGASWQLYRTVDPVKQQFMFRAANDGEFWFLVRTLDRSGQVRPEGPPSPGLKVVVDTTPPKLKLDARRGAAGEVVVQWKVEELNLRPSGVTLQYRAAPAMPWQPVVMGRPDIRTNGIVQIGEVALYPPAELAQMELRAEAVDMAGNPAVANASVKLDAAGAPAARPAAGPPPIAMPTAKPSPVAVAGNARDKNSWQAANPDPPPMNWPAAQAAAPSQIADGRNQFQPELGTSPLRPANSRTQVAISDAGRTDTQDGSVAIQINPALRNQFIGMNNSASAAPPPGPRPHMVNSRVFELEYDLQSVGPSGIKQVDLWCTRDGGRTWKLFAVDESKHSPMVVTVSEEGIYGFRMVVRNGAGLGSKEPKSGDPAEIVIGVDLTKPTARITAAEQGVGADATKLNISWQASDNQMLAARPISLHYSQTRGGPWTPIATELENTGHYAWTIGNRAPQQAYLRLEARDEAGNVGAYETPQPIPLDRMSPAAHILDVRPVGESGQRMADRNVLR